VAGLPRPAPAVRRRLSDARPPRLPRALRRALRLLPLAARAGPRGDVRERPARHVVLAARARPGATRPLAARAAAAAHRARADGVDAAPPLLVELARAPARRLHVGRAVDGGRARAQRVRLPLALSRRGKGSGRS